MFTFLTKEGHTPNHIKQRSDDSYDLSPAHCTKNASVWNKNPLHTTSAQTVIVLLDPYMKLKKLAVMCNLSVWIRIVQDGYRVFWSLS